MAPPLPPGPKLPPLIQGVGHWNRPLAYFEKLRARYGNRFTIRLPFTPAFVIHADPEHIKEIYTAAPDVLAPGEGGAVLEPLVGRHSVILLDGDRHMQQRKLMLPAFHGEKMAKLEDLIREVTQEEIETWGRDDTISVHARTQALTLEIILRAVFGLDPGPRLDLLRDRLTTLLAFGDNPLTMIPPPEDREELQRNMERLNKFGPLKGFLDLRLEIHGLVGEQITERRREGNEGRDDILSMFADAKHEDGSPMSDDEINDELMTLLVAGHETTASSLAWGLERLAREPEVTRILSEEVAGSDNGPYLMATLQEILRRRPVLPNTLPRYVKKPIEVGGWQYEPEQHASLVANAYLVHHDPAIYPDPYAFRPERFIDRKPGTYTWIPFGGGRRRCLGASFATLEMRIVLAAVLRTYRLAPIEGDHEVALRRNITVRPHLGATVGLESRAPVATLE